MLFFCLQIILRNGTHILTGVSDASTQHIQKLVASQKLDRRKCAASGMGGTCQPRRCGVNNGRRFSKSVQNFDRGDNVPASLIRQHQHSHARHRNLPSVPAYVRSRIHEVVEKHPDGLPLPQVSDMFNKHCGVPLDYLNMGFSSVYDLLASLMDTVVMKQRPDGEIWLMSAKAGLSGGKTQNFQREHSKSVTDTQSSASPACQDERTSVKTDMGLVAKGEIRTCFQLYMSDSFISHHRLFHMKCLSAHIFVLQLLMRFLMRYKNRNKLF